LPVVFIFLIIGILLRGHKILTIEDDLELKNFLQKHTQRDRLDRSQIIKNITSELEDQIHNSMSIAITGGWGTGKSYVIKKVIEEYNNNNKDKNIVIYTSFLGTTNYNDFLTNIMDKIANEIEKRTFINVRASLHKYAQLVSTYEPAETKTILDIFKYSFSEPTINSIQEKINLIVGEFDLKLYIFIDDIERDPRMEVVIDMLKTCKDLLLFKSTKVVAAFDKKFLSRVIGFQITRNRLHDPKRYDEYAEVEGEIFLGGNKFFQKTIGLPVITNRERTKIFTEMIRDQVYTKKQNNKTFNLSPLPFKNVRTIIYAANLIDPLITKIHNNELDIKTVTLFSAFKSISEVNSMGNPQKPRAYERFKGKIEEHFAQSEIAFLDDIKNANKIGDLTPKHNLTALKAPLNALCQGRYPFHAINNNDFEGSIINQLEKKSKELNSKLVAELRLIENKHPLQSIFKNPEVKSENIEIIKQIFENTKNWITKYIDLIP
jgi:Cdc6-like AAA superfamily ATPase